MSASGETRNETDSMGSIEVPADRYWGAQTQRSLHHFTVGQERMPVAVVHAYGELKRAAAEVNRELERLDQKRAELVVRAATEVAEGALDDHFPLFIWQTGSGTQTNMNANEVIANRAIELSGGEVGSKDPVHPNDHVNLGQSSNDSFPTAMHIASARQIDAKLLPALRGLRDAFAERQAAFGDVVKIGRTHLQDATPLTVAQEVSGWVALLDAGIAGIERTRERLLELAIGGTAVGTGLNTHPEFGDRVAKKLASRTGLAFRSADNKFAALSAHDAMVEVHGSLKTLATSLTKIANDVRFLGSGPRSGLGELRLPANEPGSSIMPGKVNPTQCESMLMVCAQVMGNDVTMGIAGASGNFELNVQKPLIVHCLLQSVSILADASNNFTEFCAKGLELERERIAHLVDQSLMLVTALAPHIGYDAAAKIAKRAHEEGSTLKQAATASGVAADDYDRWVDPKAMTHPE